MKSRMFWGACALSLALVCAPLAFAAGTTSGSQPSMQQANQQMAGYRDWTSQKMHSVQKALIAHGANIAATGHWNDATRAAVKIFQKESGLDVTGFPNQATVAALGLGGSD
ncbi:MAG: peptidoglycan-binding protein [Gammaproteobacteria bacterium]|nr:peptidoglycan-binding protein [Gammaproteobacteria bacterium]